MLKNFISKAMASLLLVAMLVSDSSVTVLAETFTDPETGIVIENMEGEEGSGQSEDQGITDEVIAEDNATGEQTDGQSEEPEEGAVEGEGAEQEESASPALLTSTGAPEDEGDYIVVDGEKIEKTIVDLGERSAETADGKPGNTRTSDFNAFSDKSRTDFFRKFYNQLSDSEKKIYKWLEEHAEDFIRYSYDEQDPNAPFAYYFVNGTTESTTNMNALLNNAHAEVINAYGCLMYDHPEIFWPDLNKISFGYAYNGAQSGSTVYYDMFRVSFSILQENNDGTATNYHSMILDRYEADTKSDAYDRVNDDKAMLTATITDILKPANGYPSTGTIYEKVCFINDELTYRNYYNRYVAKALEEHRKDEEGRYPHVAPSALHNGTLTWLTEGGMGAHEAPVCESYANAFKAVCDEAGIPCIVVSGADHMWNYVQDDDGVWYAVDTTWDDPVRSNEWTLIATPEDDIRRFCMVGSATKCDGTHTFGSEHPANAAYAIDGKVPAWPTISTERCNNNLLGAELSTVEDPTASNGVITAKFTTDKTGRYYWVVREHGDTAPTIYDIQDGVATVTDGAGNGVISQAKPDSADPFVMETTVLAPGFYDLYIMQLTGYEYISNVIKYDNIRVSNALSSITLNDIQPDASKGVPRKNTLYVSAGIPVTYTIEPEELTDEVTVTLTSTKPDVVQVRNSDVSVWGNQQGSSEITATAKFTDEDGTVHTVESNPITVTVIYPAHRIFEKYGRKYYATSETELYTGWLVEKNGTCTLKPETPDIAYELGRGAHVYYFDPTDGDNKYKAVKGKQHIGRTDYLFGSDGILIKEWLMLESITINSVPAEANQSGPIDVNTLSYGSSAKLTAVCNPGRTTDDLDPVWTSSDPSVIRVTPAGKTFTIHQGGDIWEMYANIDVLKLPEDPTHPITIKVEAGQTTPDNRKWKTIDIYVTRPVGWFTVSGKTYYGEVVEVAGRKQVEFVTGWWPKPFDERYEAEKEYYFDANGVMATGLVDIGTAIYDFGHDGVLRKEREKKGFVELSGQTFYYDDAGDLVKNDVVSDELGNHFFMDAGDGHMLTECWIEFTPDGSSTEHYLYADKDGKLADGLTRINGQMYFFTTSEDGDNVPCSLATGRQDINNAPYYFFDDTDYTKCYMAMGYFEAGSNRYYALPDSDRKAGQLQSGWVFVDDTNIGGTVVPAAWRQFADSEAADPYAEITSASREGWIRMDDGTRYYRNSKGVQVTGWQTIDGHKYYFNADGSVVTGLVQIPATKGSWYYFGEIDDFDHPESENYGIMQTGRATTGGRSYFFNASGVRVTGWQKDTNASNPTFGKWDFYDPANDGEALNAINTTLYSDPNWYTIGEARFYYINGTTLAKGWQTIDGCRYYFNPNANAAGVPGQMAVGVTTIGSAKYYLRETDSETRMGDLLTGHDFARDKDDFEREYLANASGVLQLGWRKADGEWAFFDYVKGYRADDAVVGTDNWVITQEGTTPAKYSKYFFKNGTTPVTGKQTINGKTYVFGTSTADGTYGRMKSGFFKEGKFWYYGTPYDETNEDSTRSTDAGSLKNGFVTDGGITRHFNNNFEMQTGWVMIGGEWHYFLTEADVASGGIAEGDPVGKEIPMTKSFEWYKGTHDPFVDIYFCFKGGSTLMKGWQTVNGYRYYFDPVTGMQITGVQKIANNWYDLGGVFADTAIGHVNGYAKTGWSDGTAAASDYYYNASGARMTGWQTIEGRKYYFRPQASGEILDGTDYGKKYKNTVLSVGKDRFVLDANGAMLTGYCSLGTKNYYTNANGVMLYGWQNVNGAMHYFRLSTDPTDPGAEDTATLGADNFIVVDGQTYYLKNGTTMATGFVDVAGKRYYFDETNTETRGQMFKDTWFFYKNKKYYAFADGHLAKGYSAIGGKNYMFGNDHTILTGIQTVDGQFMFFDPDADQNTAEYGARKDYTPANGIAGFFRTDTGTIFYIKNGKIQTGWQTVEGRKYYFDATGVLQPGLYNPDTELYEGEFKIGNKIYRSYTYAEAHALGDDALEGSVYSGFKNYERSGKKWTCYYDANGLCASGWVKYDNGFYYFNPDDGVMQIGCFTVGNYMYFSDKNGRRLTGLVKYNNNTYFCDGNGIAKSGWQTVKVDGENRKFWFDANGVMLTGLQKIGNYWYYFQDVPGMVEGQMRTGFFTIDRSGDKYSYNANSSGVLQFGPAQNNGDWSYYASEYDNNTYSDSIDIGAGYVYEPYSNERPGWYKVKFTDADPGVYGTDYIYLYATKGNNPSKGWQSVPGLDGNKHKYYFNPSNGALMIGRITVSGKDYQLGDDEADLSTFGTFSADTIGFQSFDGGSTWYYFDANATLVTGWVNKVYGPKDTHKEAGLGSFYLDPNEGGKLATGLTVIGKNTYYLENRDDRVPGYGRRVDSEVVPVGSDRYIFGSNGVMLTGWQNVDDGVTIRKQYFAPELQSGTEYTDRSGYGSVYVLRVGNNIYRLDDQAYAYPIPVEAGYTKGFDPVAGIYQDANAKIATGLQSITMPTPNPNSKVTMYFSPENGLYADNEFVTVGKNTYYFGEDIYGRTGVMLTGYQPGIGGENYLFASNGVMLTGWQKCPDGLMRLFDTKTGKEITGVSSVYPVTASEGWYEYADDDGRIVRYYLRNGKPLTGWQAVNTIYGPNHEKGRFYFNPDGTVAYSDTGEISVSNVIYNSLPYKEGGSVVPNSDYGRMTEGFYEKDGGFRYADANGKMITGWLTLPRGVDKKKYKYYLSSAGMLCTGVTDVGGYKYYLMDYDPVSHADKRDPRTNYEFGALQLGAGGVIRSENPAADYRVNSSGVIQSGWVFIKNGTVYDPEYYDTKIDTFGQKIDVIPLVDGTGTKRTDWYTMDGDWYLIEGGKTLRKGNYAQTVTIAGVRKSLLFALDPTTGALYDTEGIFNIGNNRYYNTGYEGGPLTGYPNNAIAVSAKFTRSGKTYCANNKGVLLTGLVNETRNKVVYTSLYNPTDCARFEGGMFTYKNNVYYAFTDDDETADRIPEGFEVGDLAKGRVTLEVDGVESGYWFDNNGVRKTGWASFREADKKTYKYYYDTDGRMLCDGQFTIAGKDYVFDADGKLYTGVYETADGSRYWSDGNGILYRGWKYVKEGAVSTWRYYRQSDGKELTTAGIDDDNKMLFMPGSIQGNYWGVVKEDGNVYAYYINKNSAPAKNTWLAIDGKRYYFDASGVLYGSGTAMQRLSDTVGTPLGSAEDVTVMTLGANRFAVVPVDDAELLTYTGGVMPVGYAVSGFLTNTDGVLFYANANGQLIKGYVTLTRDKVNWKYYADTNFRILTGPSYIGANKYLFDTADNYGQLLSIDHKNALTGLVQSDGKEYLTDNNGVILTGWRNVKTAAGAIWYYFDPATGEKQTIDHWAGNWVVMDDGKVFYIANQKTLTKGFAKVYGTYTNPTEGIAHKFYFDASTGELLKAAPGDEYASFENGGYTYEVDEDGVLTVGWGRAGRTETTNPNIEADSWYDANGRMVKGAVTVTGKGAGYYYFDNNGKMVTGISKVNGKTYMYGSNTAAIAGHQEISYDRGKLHKNYYGEQDDTAAKYKSDGNGVMMTGWQYFKTGTVSEWHYFDFNDYKENTTAVWDSTKNWCTLTLNEGGKDVRAKYYFKNNSLLKGFQLIGGRRYYFDTTGRMATGLWNISGVLYYFNETVDDADPSAEGMLLTNGITNSGGKYYYMGSDGKNKKGWFTISGSRYYADPVTGELAVGLVRLDGKNYFFSDADATLGQMQTGFFRISDFGQKYYDTTEGASNMYYADANGVILNSGWTKYRPKPKDPDPQDWSFYAAPNLPGIDMGEFTLTGEIAAGDVLIDTNGLVWYLDDGVAGHDGFAIGQAYSGGTTTAEDIEDYFRFDPDTGARRKEVLYFYGNYYGMDIDANQTRTINTMRCYMNTDMKYSTPSDDFIIVNNYKVVNGKQVGDNTVLRNKGLTNYDAATFPMCASNKDDAPSEEKAGYVAENDLNHDDIVDVQDAEIYSKDVYDRAIAKYGPRNLILAGASSGAGICLGLYNYAFEREAEENKNYLLPEQVLLLSPWIDVSMTNPKCTSISKKNAGPTDVGTLKYWGERYTRTKGVTYSFATSLNLRNVDKMDNIFMYTGTYDPCNFDCGKYADIAKAFDNLGVKVNYYSGEQHGFMFFAADRNAVNVTVDFCRKVMTN